MTFSINKLGEVADVIDSLHKTPKYTDSGHPMVRCTDVKYGCLSLDGTLCVDDEVFKEFSRRYKPQPNDIIITRVGSYGNMALVEDTRFCLGQNTAAIVPKINPRFLYFALNSPMVKQQIEFSVVGSTQKTLSLKAINNLDIPRFDPAVEDRIADIVGGLDDKIELNRQINQTLEQLAQTIFKSWFVAFEPVKAKFEAKAAGRDPERAAMCAISGKLEPELDQLPPEQGQQLAATAALFPDELVESEVGLLPEGWQIGTVHEEFDLTMGQSPPGNTYNESGEGLPFYQGRTDFGFRFPTHRVFCTAPTRFADVGDTLVSVRAPVGDINMATERCCIGRGVAAARHKSRSSSYTYYFMQSIEEVFDRFEAEGTVFGSISKKDFHNIQCIKTSARIVSEFERLVSPIDGKIENKEQESRTLATLRDTLLPKLLSGELAVESLPLETTV